MLPVATGPLAGMGELSAWRPIGSGEAELRLGTELGPEPGSAALRFDFDFHGSGGFVVARREVRLRLPESFAVRFSLKGQGSVNDVEVKWVDVAGSSVWRHVLRLTSWPEEWRVVELRDRDFPFAWGPAGGGRIGEIGAIELVLVAGEGGCGTVWLSELMLEDRTVYDPPAFFASSHQEDHSPEAAGDPLSDNFWESALGDPAPMWTADWKGEREFGGLGIRWARNPVPPFVVEKSADGSSWSELERVDGAVASGTFLPLASTDARFLRLRFEPGSEGDTVAMTSVELMPREFGESRDAAFHAMASMAPRGWFPRYWLREQSYWTPFGPPEGSPRGLMNEEGLVEPGGEHFSLEPFLWHEARILTWADATLRQEQTEGWIPAPVSVWEVGVWRLRIAASGTKQGNVVRYCLENTSGSPQSVRFFVALRPFHATPPWQAFRGTGGTGKLEELWWEGEGRVFAGEGSLVRCNPGPSSFGVATARGGELLEVLARGEVPKASVARDASGLVSGAFAWDFSMAPGEVRVVEVTVGSADRMGSQTPSLEEAVRGWEESPIASSAWQLPGGNRETQELVKTMLGATAQILVNRDGAALQPGPRRYQRCWIRDAAGMARALLYAGCRDEVMDLLTWYAPYVREDGMVPCCVDREGADWLPEHDSQGQFVHVLAEYARFGGDLEKAAKLWPVAVRTVERLAAMRETRMTEAYASGNPPHRFGLLPESASHEGYLAHPVHAYWDDFWALRGLRDAAWLAGELGDAGAGDRFSALRDSFTETLAASLDGLVRDRKLSFVPGSVEWADFDPSATANGVALLGELPGVPRELLEKTYSAYLVGFRERRDGKVAWENYTPYEIRNIGALIRMGWRAEAWELLQRFQADRRPREWNQWPEIAWRDLRAPGHLGDVPHTWIGAEFVAAARSFFVYERDADASLVLAAGVPADWLREPGGLSVRGWVTAYGPLTYSLHFTGPDEAVLQLSAGLRMPAGGVKISFPHSGKIAEFLVNGLAQPIPEGRELRVLECPAEARIRFVAP